jgi:hypothetical protein
MWAEDQFNAIHSGGSIAVAGSTTNLGCKLLSRTDFGVGEPDLNRTGPDGRTAYLRITSV